MKRCITINATEIKHIYMLLKSGCELIFGVKFLGLFKDIPEDKF